MMDLGERFKSLVNKFSEPTLSETEAQQSCEKLISSLHAFFERLATDYNARMEQEPMMLTVRRQDLRSTRVLGSDAPTDGICRLIVSTAYWALTLRATARTIEAFSLPATELMTLPSSELPSRAKLTLILGDAKTDSWMMNNVVISADEMTAIVRGLIKDLIARSKSEYENVPESMKILSSRQSFAGSVRSLVEEKHALVQKIVDQQEAIQNQVAMELHDSVLGNVMLLKRSLSGSKRLSDEEALAVLDAIAIRLREVCSDLSPRDLSDCGLKPILEELCHNIESRTDCECSFVCEDALPDFPYEVELHIYRIAQECFNNVVKHASATQVELSIKVEESTFSMTICDNGVGFDANQPAPGRRPKDGGTGASIIKERTELISCFYPANVRLGSQVGQGTTMTLEIMLAPRYQPSKTNRRRSAQES
jgi:signal transduction histidine kinase